MNISNLITSYHFECLVRKHWERFGDFDQKFLVAMLVKDRREQPVTEKQYRYCQKLVDQMKTYEKLL